MWLSERLDIKVADVILSAIAARTSRLEVGAGLVAAGTRNPWLMAALGATMQACHGTRFNLGLGRGDAGSFCGSSFRVTTYGETSDYIDILHKLWRGERINYNGPAGHFDGLKLSETHHGPPPPVWMGGYSFPRGAQLIAERCDGALLIPMLTPDAVRAAKQGIVAPCEQVRRAPGTVRIAALVVTAPDLSDTETRALAHARMVTYLTYPGNAETLVKVNGWDRSRTRPAPRIARRPRPTVPTSPATQDRGGHPRRLHARMQRDRHSARVRGNATAFHRRGS